MKLQMLIDNNPVGQPMTLEEVQKWQYILKRNFPGVDIRVRKVN